MTEAREGGRSSRHASHTRNHRSWDYRTEGSFLEVSGKLLSTRDRPHKLNAVGGKEEAGREEGRREGRNEGRKVKKTRGSECGKKIEKIICLF